MVDAYERLYQSLVEERAVLGSGTADDDVVAVSA
jgi:hypothetical protein